jgi:outer membrane protein
MGPWKSGGRSRGKEGLRCRFGLALAAFFWSALATPGARAETLQDVLVEAYSTNPQILAERAKLRQVDEGVPQALSGWRPTILLSGETGRLHQDTSSQDLGTTSFTGSTSTIDASIDQPLYRGGQTVAKTATAEDKVSAERARDLGTEATVFGFVIQYYLDVMRDTAIVALDAQYEQALQQELEVNTGRQGLGELTRTDVLQTEGRFEAATAQHRVDEGTLQASRANYARYVGHPPGALSEPTTRPAIPASRDDLLKLSATSNMNVVAAIFDERAAQDAVAALRGRLLPSLDLLFDAQRDTSTLNTLNNQTITRGAVTVRLTVPLYDTSSGNGDAYSLTRQAIDAVGQALHVTDDARRQAVQAAVSAWDTVMATRAQIARLEAAIRAEEGAVEGLRREQLAGARTITDVLDAQLELFGGRTALVRAQHDMHLAEFIVAQQIGNLTVSDLGLPIEPYDVRTHYDMVHDKWLGFGGASDH